MKLWRNRRWLGGALGEIGCGFLTVLLITLPLWIFTVAARGPGFALAVFALMIGVLVALGVVSRWFRRRF